MATNDYPCTELLCQGLDEEMASLCVYRLRLRENTPLPSPGPGWATLIEEAKRKCNEIIDELRRRVNEE